MRNELQVGFIVVCNVVLAFSAIASAPQLLNPWALPDFNEKTESYKRIVVIGVTDPEMIPCAPETWTDDFILISHIAHFFTAEVIRNYPFYGFCIVRVPTKYYHILTFIYRIFGYYVRDEYKGQLF